MTRGRTKGDHDARRTEIAEVACTVFLRLGLERTSLADIARELGNTTGVLRHYFANKDELLFYAKNLSFNQFHSNAIEAAAHARGLDAIRAYITGLVPITPAAIDRYKLLAMFNGSAIGDARLMKLQNQRNEMHSNHLATIIAKLQKEGELPKSLDPKMEAAGLLAMLDGLADRVIMLKKQWPAKALMDLVNRYIDNLNRPPRADAASGSI
jgi:AcrR family transcriptional regulator